MTRIHVDLELRWGDQDAYGHVNNVAYARFLEEARVRTFFMGMARENTGLEKFFGSVQAEDPKLLVASQKIEFLHILEYEARSITVDLWVSSLGGSSLQLNYEIVDYSKGKRLLIARAVTTVVMVDGVNLRPTRFSAEAREAVKHWQDEPVEFSR